MAKRSLRHRIFRMIWASAFSVVSCVDTPGPGEESASSCEYARYVSVTGLSSSPAVITVSPFDGSRDTLLVRKPMDNIICMSSSHVACLAALDADSVITAVSGLRYISNPALHRRAALENVISEAGRPVYDIGYENSLDYERILSLKPDLLVAYTVAASEPQYLAKLRSLGIPVLILHDHLEDHPLARAEYIRVFGVLTARQAAADSVFALVRDRYLSLAARHTVGKENAKSPVRVLVNIPYADSWYVPGGDSYMARLVHDAGGEILGAEKGTSASRVISVETAYGLSRKADLWLNPGWCTSLSALKRVNPMFGNFGPVAGNLPVYNNTLKVNDGGGNDFWESGAVRPDLILEDLIHIMSEGDRTKTQNESREERQLNYHYRLLP